MDNKQVALELTKACLTFMSDLAISTKSSVKTNVDFPINTYKHYLAELNKSNDDEN
ncbi:hypothetical protein ACQW5G_01310 [Fructilactobacillus sp. Tb1]|uniref:hypothetical protein n=1 Tax=Fructilactobacillus sp. Tb1 TaxID=3422304 RepID=UPI003D28D140